MTDLEMYERVLLTVPLDERRFFNFLDDSVDEVMGLYGDVPKLVFDEGATEGCKHPVKPLYHGAILDNILFLAGAGEHHKSEFLRKAEAAYLKYWNENARGRRLKRYV